MLTHPGYFIITLTYTERERERVSSNTFHLVQVFHLAMTHFGDIFGFWVISWKIMAIISIITTHGIEIITETRLCLLI